MSHAISPAPADNPDVLAPSTLVNVVDGMPETAGLGVVLIQHGSATRVRDQGTSGATVIFEVREQSNASTPLPAPAPVARTSGTSPAMEWVSLGFNCGGAVLAWVGVAGLGSLAPVTGGLTGIPAAIVYGGALATSGQCLVSTYRVANVERGRTDLNKDLDANSAYIFTMTVADGVGLLGGGGALIEIKRTNAILEETHVGWGMGLGKLSRPVRRRLTAALELQGGKRAPGVTINRLLRQRLLDATAGVIGMVGSGTTGLLHSVVVWITSEASELGQGP